MKCKNCGVNIIQLTEYVEKTRTFKEIYMHGVKHKKVNGKWYSPLYYFTLCTRPEPELKE